MYYIIINSKWTPITAKALRGAKRQATRRGADVVYETRESDRKDRYTGEAVNALISVAKKGLHWTTNSMGYTSRISPDKWIDTEEFVEYMPANILPV